MSSFRKDQGDGRATDGFILFVREFGSINQIFESFETLKDIAQPYWDKLSMNQKYNFEQKAKNYQQSSSLKNDINNLTSRGHDEVRKSVKLLLESANCRRELDTMHFYFISSIALNDTNIIPVEFSIGAFSLKSGVMKDLCINMSLNQQKEAHPPVRDHIIDAIEATFKLLEFFKHLKVPKFPLIFFTNGNFTDDFTTYDANKQAFKLILEKAGEYALAKELKIFPLNYLLYYMKYVVKSSKDIDNSEQPFLSLEAAHKIIETDMKKFERYTISCDYHEEKFQASSCSLPKVRSSSYIIAKYCIDRRRYQLFEGIHYPVGKRDEYEVKKEENVK